MKKVIGSVILDNYGISGNFYVNLGLAYHMQLLKIQDS